MKIVKLGKGLVIAVLLFYSNVAFAETFGNVYVGDVGHSYNWAGFGHKDIVGTLSYALLQSNDGAYTLINKKDTGSGFIGFRINNADKMVISNAGNVGIGTATPDTALRIWRTSGQGDALLAITGGACNTLVLAEGDTTNIANIKYDGTDLRIGSSNLDTLNIKGGNVGIGTLIPLAKLDVNGAIRTSSGGLTVTNNTDSTLVIVPVGSGQTRIKTDAANRWISFADGAGNTDVLAVKGGSVCIGTTNPQTGSALSVSGSGYFTGIVTTGSSRSLKHDIKPLATADALAALEKIAPMRFRYNASGEDEKLGFISEDVPGLVAEKDGKSLNSMDFIAVAIAVIKDQQARIEKLEKEIESMK